MHEVTVRHFIIATAGHVDHGKSALVKALTGTIRIVSLRKRKDRSPSILVSPH